MKIYQEIIDFLNSNAIHQGKSLILRPRKRSQSDILYDKFLNEEVKNEEEAAIQIFGKWDYRYRKLRGRFIDNLTTSVLMIDFKGQRLENYSKVYYSCLRELTVARILQGRTLYRSSTFFAKRCYKKCKQFRHYDLLFDAVKLLKGHEGTRLLRARQFERYDKELEEIRKIVELEDLAESNYSKMIIFRKNNRHNIAKCLEYYQNLYDELKDYLNNCNGLKYQLMTRLIRIGIYNIQYDFEKMLYFINEDLRYFLSQDVRHSVAIQVLIIQKIAACIRIGAYYEGIDTLKKAFSFIDEKSANWFPLKYREFFIYMQSGNYFKAKCIYDEITKHRRYNTLVSAMKEDWEVGGAYLNYIIESGQLETEQAFKFRLGKFLNSVPEYSKDRRVKNIPILIAQILFMIQKGQTSKAIDRIEAIQMYCYGNLRYNEAVRSNAFIRMLLEIPKRSFKKQPVLDRVGKYLDKLKEVPLHQSGKNFDLELIPYERLWEYVVSNLK